MPQDGRTGGYPYPCPPPPRANDGYVTKGDLEGWELRMEDAYDKLHHLYDRTRKRLKVTDQENPPPPAPAGAASAGVLSAKEIKAAIRDRLRVRRLQP